MALDTAPHHTPLQHNHLHHRGQVDSAMAALKLAATSPFFPSNHATIASPPLTPASRQPALHPISTNTATPTAFASIPSPILLARAPMASNRGPTKPLTLQHQPGPHASHSGAHPSPQTPHFRSNHHPLHNHHHHSYHISSSLPSPPLSSVEPPPNSGFFPKSPLQERCEALETELSALRLRLKRSERSSTVREKRLSLFQQQSSDSQQSLQTIAMRYESTLSQFQEMERELGTVKTALTLNEGLVRQLKATTIEQETKLSEILSERATLSAEMKESYSENSKLQRRLKTNTEKVEKLQQENRQLIDQLKELRTKVVEVSDAQLDAVETLDREKTRGGQAVLELEKEASKHKAEVDRLQDLVLMMGNRHVQVQAQLTFFQQQAHQLQQQLDQSTITNLFEHKNINNIATDNKAPVTHSTNPSTTATKHGSLMMGDSTLTSLLTSVASVAATSHSRRAKPTRRFTVNAPRKDGELTLEQRKCEFLMDQISVLQRGYDALRQEKVTLELQLDLMQRQHQYHQQQRQKRRDSQRRTLGHEQSAALSNALAIIVSSSPVASGTNALSTIPSTPLLPTISAAEQEREKARIQHELEQAQIRAQQEAEAKEARRLAAKAAAEEAEREAIRLRRAKSLHLKEALASLESKRDRSDTRTIQFSSSEELKHLEQLRHINEPQKQRSSSEEGGMGFQNAAAARISRRIVSPFSSSHYSSPSSTPSPSPASSSSSNSTSTLASSSASPLSTMMMPSPLSTKHHPAQHYTQASRHQRAGPRFYPTYTYNIEQCSCCLGTMIEL